jgi:isopenicillin-N N-acyltransferase like protein
LKKIFSLTIVAFFIFSFTSDKLLSQEGQLTQKGNLRILKVVGTPYERGFQHGQLLKIEINELVQVWKNDLQKTYKMNPDSFITSFINGTKFIPTIKKYTPNLFEEVRGIADGAEIDFKTMYAFQLVDEQWVLGQKIANAGCTSFAVRRTKNNPTINAQNLDIPFFHGYATLLHMKDPKADIEAFVLTFPGLIGTNGMNNKPVSVCVNAMTQLKPAEDGLPVAFVVRGVLEQRSYSEAKVFLKKIKHAAGQNYIIADMENMSSFECSEQVVSSFVPFEGATFTYHTNHPLTNNNYNDDYNNYFQKQNIKSKEYIFRCHRFNSLSQNFSDNSSVFDVEKIKSILSNRDWGICHRNNFGCTIMVLKDQPEFHVSAGQPDIEPFYIFKF